MMAEGVIVVPLYARQAADELAGMMKDCRPRLLFVGDAAPGEALAQAWHDAPPRVTLDQALNENVSKAAGPGGAVARADSEIVTIIYTSGTSGEPKGVRRGVEEALSKRAAPIQLLDGKSRAAWQRQKAASASATDRLWLWLAKKLIFSKIKARFGHDLRALICGSAPLAPETQQFFQMLGIPVLQAYGLTETTGICTMDDPREPAEPGYVGSAIPGMEMKVGENEEIVTRVLHIFPGYWNRPEETARVLQAGWFHTGDQGERNARGKWRISGRIKNLIVLNSGHKVAPEPMEEKIAGLLPAAQQVVSVGHGRRW